MKFLACTHCFTVNSSRHPSKQPIQEITNPLVVTKRPVPKVLHSRNGDKTSPKPPASKKRFPALLSALTSWSRRRQPKKPKHPSPIKNIRKTVRIIEPPPRRRPRQRPPTRTQRLIRLYEERATSPEANYHQDEFLIDPPASFSGGDNSLESHQNFKNKLNTLDFKRMNTVALEEPLPPLSRSKSATYRKNSYNESKLNAIPISKCARKTLLEDFLKERLRIEQTMIDLLNGRDPGSIILKKSRNEDKKVRFKVEELEKELRYDLTDERKVALKDDGRAEQETEIKLSVDPATKVEDFYVERRTTYLKDKTVEDKALVVKIAAMDESGQRDVGETIGMNRPREMVLRNFGKMSL